MNLRLRNDALRAAAVECERVNDDLAALRLASRRTRLPVRDLVAVRAQLARISRDVANAISLQRELGDAR